MEKIGSLNQEFKPKEYEERLLKYWKENRIYDKVRMLLSDKPKFYFLDGPPYPSSDTPHIGTIWNKVLKDAIIRFWRARGYKVNDQPGYDCHGLPIEVKIEQSLGFKGKKEIEDYGVDKFVKDCESFALSNVKAMTEHFWNFGVSMDWERPYLTLRNEYIEGAWWLVKKAHEKGLLEKGVKVVHWCPRCETTLADYEITEYKVLRDPSIYVKFPVKGQKGKYVMIWTTTPWTLPANVFVMAHPEFDYVWVEVDGEQLLILKDRLEAVMAEAGVEEYKIVKEVKGKELEGLEYEHPLKEEVKVQQTLENVHRIVLCSEYVRSEEGTGLVHSAPGHGEEDFEVGKAYNFPVVAPVDDKGVFTEDAGKYAGKHVREANDEIISDLEKKGVLFHKGIIEHRYPICWRCKTPLIMRATSQWYIRVTQLKERFLEEAARVNWVPEWAGYARFRNWLKGLRDWIISRQRYWGTPVPIWICENCGHVVVIGSLKELEELSGSKLELKDLHRPWIDKVTLKCPKCNEMMRRTPDVLDVWLDSGVAFYASLNYPLEKELFEKWWPADFITEGHDQIAGWFFSLLRCGLITFDKAPYKTVLMHGFALDEHGREMHKSLGNYIAPQEVLEFEKGSRDVLRWFVLRNTIWEDLKFSWKSIAQAYDDLHILWNVYYFATTYMSLDSFNPREHPLTKYMQHLREEDKWILSRVESVAKEATEYFEKYHIHRAARLLRDFIVEDVSRWYIRLVRPRVWIEKDDPDKLAAYATLYHVLFKFLKLLAPIAPFITEKIYLDAFRTDKNMPESIHMFSWPEAIEEYIDRQLEEQMNAVRKIVESGLAARMKAGIKIRQPLPELVVATDDDKLQLAVRRLSNIIKSQVNVKHVKVVEMKQSDSYYKYEIKPVYRSIGPVFKAEAKMVIDALEKADTKQLKKDLEEKGFATLSVGDKNFEIKPEMVEFEKTTIPDYTSVETDNVIIFLNTRISLEELAEGFARDILRRIQFMRKEADLPIDAYIETVIFMPSDMKQLFQKYIDYVASEARSKHIQLVDSREKVVGEHVKEWEIGDVVVKIGIKKL